MCVSFSSFIFFYIPHTAFIHLLYLSGNLMWFSAMYEIVSATDWVQNKNMTKMAKSKFKMMESRRISNVSLVQSVPLGGKFDYFLVLRSKQQVIEVTAAIWHRNGFTALLPSHSVQLGWKKHKIFKLNNLLSTSKEIKASKSK